MTALRPYDPDTDREQLWELKAAFETAMGDSGTAAKAAAYDDKLTDSYRTQYLEWVEHCVDENSECVQLAVRDGDCIGYVFVLPESLAYIWDGAVLNEIYVNPEFRGTGVADDLFEAAHAVVTAQDLPMDRLLLDVDRDNPRARQFYDRHEFSHWGDILARDL